MGFFYEKFPISYFQVIHGYLMEGTRMAQTLVRDAVDFMPTQSSVSMRNMPLSFMKPGESGRIAKVREKGDVHHHLENLGFVAGAPVAVVNEQGGNFIVEIKGAQIAIDRKIAQKIVVA